MNYFELFALPETFDLDVAKLSEAFQSLQKTVHPDKFAHASSQEQLLAVQKSATINDAYQTLKNPLKRAEYILQNRGTTVPNEQTTFQDNTFLMHQMELYEMLEELPQASDVDEAITAASDVLASEYQTLFCQLQQQLQDNSPASDKIASETVRKLKFYQKLQRELERIEEELFDD